MGCFIFSRVATFCRKILNRQASDEFTEDQSLQVYQRQEHGISRKDISENALKVLYRLNKAGFDAYLVGGGVRDLLLNKQPKDFDIATNATPEEIKALFRNCRLVGRRFRLAHILFGRDIIEVATFRGHHSDPQPLPKEKKLNRNRLQRKTNQACYCVITCMAPLMKMLNVAISLSMRFTTA